MGDLIEPAFRRAQEKARYVHAEYMLSAADRFDDAEDEEHAEAICEAARQAEIRAAIEFYLDDPEVREAVVSRIAGSSAAAKGRK